ncbi:nucleolar protein 9 [Melopsittacus undulatus]|nr:nucleolar protein 9 [Melopsittacus undulatus]
MAVKRSGRTEAGSGSRPRFRAGARARLDPDTAAYFRRALETLQEGLSPEELALFTPNVLHEASMAAPIVALDPGGSRLLEALLPTAPLPLMGQLLPPLLQGGLQGPMGHPLGARVLEAALLRVLSAMGQGEAAMGQVEDAIGRLGVTVGGALVAAAKHPPSSFVVRALLRVLGGAPQEGRPPGGAGLKPQWAEPESKGAEPKPKGAELPPSFPPLLEQLAEAFEKHLQSLLSPPCASLCLQVALEVLHRSQSPSCARLCCAVIGQLAPGPGGLVPALEDPTRSRVLEAAIGVMTPPLLRELYQSELKGRLRGVANHRVANHGLQRLLDHTPYDVVEAVLSELGPSLAEPLTRGHHGVLTALMGACRRHPPLQQGALRCLLQAFGCWEPANRRKDCVRILAKLRPFEGGAKEPEGEELELPLPASLLLHHVLHFRDPAPVLGGLRSLPPPSLLALAHAQHGRRLWGALLSSASVRACVKQRLLRRLKGHWASLACHRTGSRVLEAAWAAASGPTREAIASELAAHQGALQRDPYGRRVARAIDLERFLRQRPSWRTERHPPPP